MIKTYSYEFLNGVWVKRWELLPNGIWKLIDRPISLHLPYRLGDSPALNFFLQGP